jgi:hypothetical protein
MWQKFLALAIILLLPVPALAGSIALRLDCQYVSYIDKEGFHWLKDRFRLTFIIDDKGSAYMLGKGGSIQVQAGRQADSWLFVEFTPDGHIRTATEVYDAGYGGYSLLTQNGVIAGEWGDEWGTIRRYNGYCVVAFMRQAPE